jgi:hypothetical protein
MNNDQFVEFVDQLVKDELVLLASKGIEYSGKHDRFRNFKRIAAELDTTPEQVCYVYLRKHIDSILTYINRSSSGEPIVQSEPIIGRINDARNYLALLAGMIQEKDNDG